MAKRHGALTFVDGGELGMERAEEESDPQRGGPMNLADKIDVISGSLAEAVGEYGGYVAASSALVNVIR